MLHLSKNKNLNVEQSLFKNLKPFILFFSFFLFLFLSFSLQAEEEISSTPSSESEWHGRDNYDDIEIFPSFGYDPEAVARDIEMDKEFHGEPNELQFYEK